ncbi:transglycosylase SLT domain-containing protein [Halodurantibacterium flavum]|uniref:Transglycosylase SLT domain-containing protein n=1 Tax=Halodurantibacterium flavum TaxID=1382802 RepID=A0ABW4S1L8_9RHOB
MTPSTRATRAACALLLATTLLTGLGWATPAHADPALEAALKRVAARDWAAAGAAAQPAGPVAADIVEWHRLRAGQGTLAEVQAFLARRPDWPGLPFLRQKGEEAMAATARGPEEIIAFFDGTAPLTADGAIAHALALRVEGRNEEAGAAAVRLWRSFAMSAEQHDQVMAVFGDLLAPHHQARLDAMLAAGHRQDAERMLVLVDPARRRLAEARIALQARQPGVDARIAAVPSELAQDAGLAWDRFAWRMVNSLYDSATDLILERSTSAEALGEPATWAPRRALLARREMREGDPARAYQVASQHHLEAGADFADLEWLAGFIALRLLDDPQTALVHFTRLAEGVSSPISLGRAGYWLGRTHAALGNAEAAQEAYAFGAQHQTSYYGLLSAEAADLPMDPSLAGRETYGDWREAGFRDSSVFQAAMMLQEAGDRPLARRFLLHLAEGLPAPDLGRLAAMALEMGEPNTALLIAKQAAARGVILPEPYFPLTSLADLDMPVRRELALAIARRESEFDHTVISPAGARGLMQVMPGTAEMMARKLGEPYDFARLTRDADYNARLGTAYLAVLIEEFGSNPVLVAAGYNAGPGRPRTWIRTLGDPREADVDVIDWVEMVPFTETRNYIMRVMESRMIYRARLAGGPVPLTMVAEMKGR